MIFHDERKKNLQICHNCLEAKCFQLNNSQTVCRRRNESEERRYWENLIQHWLCRRFDETL